MTILGGGEGVRIFKIGSNIKVGRRSPVAGRRSLMPMPIPMPMPMKKLAKTKSSL
jgi:hypothetical protein